VSIEGEVFMKKIVVIFIVFIFSLQISVADSVTVKGQGTVDYESGTFSSGPDKKDIKKAKKKALKKAWKKYVSKFSGAKRKAYRSVQDDFLSNIDDYIIGSRVVETEIDEDSETVTVYIRAEIDDDNVQAQLNESMPSSGGGGEKLAHFFVTRQQGSIKQKEDKVTKIVSAESIHTASEKVKASGGSAASLDKEKAVAKSVTGGNTVRYSENVTWVEKDSSGDAETKLAEVLQVGGYMPEEYGSLVFEECGGGPTVETMRDEYAKKGGLNSKTKSTIKKVAKSCRVAFLAIGTFDIFMATKDPVTGLDRVEVKVSMEVFDTRGPRARAVASVSGVQYSGLGVGSEAAENQALKKAGSEAGKTIINKLGMI
jgi:hypothetical protein